MRDENAGDVFKEMLEDCVNDGDGHELRMMRFYLEEAEERYVEQWGDLNN